MPDDEDDGRKAEPIAPVIDRTLAEIIRKNVERRIIKPARLPAKPQRTQEEIVAATLGRSTVVHAKPLPWAVEQIKQAEDRINRRPQVPTRTFGPALIPVTLRDATELPFPATMFRLNGAVFISTTANVWRATTQYDRLVERLRAADPVAHIAIFKSLTSPTVVPRNVTLIKPKPATPPKETP